MPRSWPGYNCQIIPFAVNHVLLAHLPRQRIWAVVYPAWGLGAGYSTLRHWGWEGAYLVLTSFHGRDMGSEYS